ncbi:MAG: glycoside hydrolase family 38 C-terminal domain-containing protein [bacterium]
MKKGLIVTLLLILATPLLAQTNVDKLVRALDTVLAVSYTNWKISPDLKSYRPAGDPTKPGFDDSQWQSLRLNQSFSLDSCWIRKEIVLPDRLLGKPTGGMLELQVSVDDYGYMWINGESKGHFPWDGEFELTRNAKPGERYLVVIKAINTGGPLRLIRAELVDASAQSLRELMTNLSMSMQVGQKLLSFDTYQTSSNKRVDPKTDLSTMDRAEKVKLNELLQSLAGQVNLTLLNQGPLSEFVQNVDAVRDQLKPIDAYAKKFTLFFNSNAHIDAAWLWRKKETVEVAKNTFGSVMNMFKARPDFTFTQSSAVYYDWMERCYPEIFKSIQQYVKQGRWELVGGMWIEPDCNLISGESWSRHLLYAKRYFREKFGVNVKIGWNPDSFGYNWNMPQFYANAGIDAFITQKIGWNDTNVFPYRLFWWEGPDGSRVLSYFPFDYVNEVKNPYRLVDWLRQYEANTGMTKMMVLFGVGNHGGGPSLDMLDRIDKMKTYTVFPKIEHGTSNEYLKWVQQHDLSKLPVWKDELYLEYHQGTFTTQANTKLNNRKGEAALLKAEKYSSLASLYGRLYNAASIEEAWKTILFNQFHDILPGSSIHEVYRDAAEEYRDAFEIINMECTSSLNHLSQQVNTSTIKSGVPVVVSNDLSWDRSDIATLELPKGDMGDYAILDLQGNEVTSQSVQAGRYQKTLLFKAENIPSIGYRTYQLAKRIPASSATAMTVTNSLVENQFFRIELDLRSGWIKSIVDKRNGKEILKGSGNELELLADYPSAYDAWNIGLTGVKYPSTFRRAEVIERGPVRIVVRLYRDFLKPGVKKSFPTEDFPSSFFTQDVILYEGVDQIFFKTNVEWWEEKTMLKVAFPLSFTDTVATYEIPFGTIQRSTQMRDSWEKAKVEVPAYRWADVSSEGYGVSLLNNSKYGYDIKDHVMRLSLLRSPKSPDPMADRGTHAIEYALYPHRGTWKDANTLRRGMEFNNPLTVTITDTHQGKLPATSSFIQLSPSNIILASIKKAEESNAWVIQMVNPGGGASVAQLTLPRAPKKALLTNFLEEEGKALEVKNNSVSIPMRQNGIATLKVIF